MIVGITGPNCSGKSKVAEYLRDKGFSRLSLSDIVREEAQKRGVAATRENLIAIGRELRDIHGPAYLAQQANRKVHGNSVIDSIRCPEEVEELRQNDGFVLVGVDAPLELRFKRSRERGRTGDGSTLEEFRKLEEEENKEKGQQLQKTLKLSDVVIVNNKTLEHLHKQIDVVLKHAEKIKK